MATDSSQAEIRALAGEIRKKPYGFEPSTLRKGVIAAIDTNTTPPTVSVTLSGDSTQIAGLHYAQGYYPTVGDVVIIDKLGSGLLVRDATTVVFKKDYSRTSSDAGNGLAFDNSGTTNKLSVDAYNGIVSDVNGVSVDAYNGILVDVNGVAVKPHATGGLQVDSNGVALKSTVPGNGLTMSSGVVQVNASSTGGMAIDADGIRVDPTNWWAGWQSLGLQSPWVTIAQAPQYRYMIDGTVWLRGGINSNGVNINNGDYITNVPSGYRPSSEQWFPAAVGSGQCANLVIYADGWVRIWDMASTPRPVHPCSLNCIRYTL